MAQIPSSAAPLAAASAPREVRYSLRQLLAEVEAERLTGAFGQEKLGQKDIRQAFRAKKGRAS